MPNVCKKELDLYIMPDEWKVFIKGVDNPLYNLLWRIIVSCGLRIQEALPLTSGDIDFKHNILRVATLKRKGHPIFEKDLPEEIVKELILLGRKEGTPYFIHKDKRMTYKRAYYMFKLYIKKAGLNERYSPHSLRHLHGILVAEATNGDIIKVSRALRHSNITTSEKYVHVSPKLRKEIAQNVWDQL